MISNSNSNITLNGTSDSDSIHNFGDNVTILSGTGDDTIYNAGNNVIIDSREGNDSINNWGNSVSISTGDGEDYVFSGGGNVSIYAGAGNDTLFNQGENNYLDAGAGDDYIYNNSRALNPTINTGSGDDTIHLWASGTSVVKTGSGNKVIIIYADNDINIIGDNGNSNVIIYQRNLSTVNATIDPGTGNDTVIGTQGKDLFIHSGGKDVIFAYGGEDTIKIKSDIKDSFVSGNDVNLTLQDNSSIIVKNAKGKYITISDKNNNLTTRTFGGSFTRSPQDVIIDFMNSLISSNLNDGPAILDEAISKATSGAVTSRSDLINLMISDMESMPNNFLREKCGLELNNIDTGAISGWDVGGKKVKTDKSIVPEIGDIDTSFSDDSFTVNGLTITLESGFSSLSETEQFVVQGLKSWWLNNSLNLIEESYGENLTFNNPRVNPVYSKTAPLNLLSEDSGALAWVQAISMFNPGPIAQWTLNVNMKYYADLDLDNKDGKSAVAGAIYLDRVLAHELTHAVMMVMINNWPTLPAYLKEGTAELTHGIDDSRFNDIETLVNNPDKMRASLTDAVSTSEVEVEDVNAPSYAGGFILLRYLAQQYSEFGGEDIILSVYEGIPDDELPDGSLPVSDNQGFAPQELIDETTSDDDDNELIIINPEDYPIMIKRSVIKEYDKNSVVDNDLVFRFNTRLVYELNISFDDYHYIINRNAIKDYNDDNRNAIRTVLLNIDISNFSATVNRSVIKEYDKDSIVDDKYMFRFDINRIFGYSLTFDDYPINIIRDVRQDIDKFKYNTKIVSIYNITFDNYSIPVNRSVVKDYNSESIVDDKYKFKFDSKRYTIINYDEDSFNLPTNRYVESDINIDDYDLNRSVIKEYDKDSIVDDKYMFRFDINRIFGYSLTFDDYPINIIRDVRQDIDENTIVDSIYAFRYDTKNSIIKEFYSDTKIDNSYMFRFDTQITSGFYFGFNDYSGFDTNRSVIRQYKDDSIVDGIYAFKYDIEKIIQNDENRFLDTSRDVSRYYDSDTKIDDSYMFRFDTEITPQIIIRPNDYKLDTNRNVVKSYDSDTTIDGNYVFRFDTKVDPTIKVGPYYKDLVAFIFMI